MDLLDEEILKVWQALQKFEVKYILVGGFATNLNGFSRTTADMDLWIKDELDNRIQLKNALESMELGDMSFIEKGELIPGWTTVPLLSGFELDLMTSMKGLPQEKFDECYSNSPVANVNGVDINFLHINYLIETKEATARPKDLIDLLELKKIRDTN